MRILESSRMGFIPTYAFDEIRKKVDELKAGGIDVIDLGVGDPARPAPENVRKRCCSAVEKYADSGYPPYRGLESFLRAAARWMKRVYGFDVNAEKEIIATLGSKEAVFHFHQGILNPADYALIPSPGYPPYTSGTLFAGGKPLFYPLDEKNGFLPDLDAVMKVLKYPPPGGKVKIMWICYPNAPTGKVADRSFFENLVAILQKYNVILASDEAYADFVYEGEQLSPLQVSSDGVIAFYSLSKRSNMTGYRVGWAAGDRKLVNILLRIKTNMDSGTPCFIQEAAAEALDDDKAPATMREEYRGMRDELVAALVSAGLDECRPGGSIYIWQRVPAGMTSRQFADVLLSPEIGVVGIPGDLIASTLEDGTNPGEGYIRFSLTCLPERMHAVCERLDRHLKSF